MNPIVFAGPVVLAALISMATLLHWDMRTRGSFRHFGASSEQWRTMSLVRAATVLQAL